MCVSVHVCGCERACVYECVHYCVSVHECVRKCVHMHAVGVWLSQISGNQAF